MTTYSLDTIQADSTNRALDLLASPSVIPADARKRHPWQSRQVQTYGSGKPWEPGTCKGCGRPIAEHQAPPITAGGIAYEALVTVCDDCAELCASYYEPAKAKGHAGPVTLTPWWDEHCPPMYRDILAGELPPAIDLRAFERVAAWRPDHYKGLLLLGDSGSGKTTSEWALAKALEREGCKPVLLSSVELARALSTSAHELRRNSWLTGCRVLIVDDLGKEKLTESVASLLWELIDVRLSHRRPLIVSTRYHGEAFVARFGDKGGLLGHDIRRRLSDACNRVGFAAQNTGTGTAATSQPTHEVLT
jgi:hypothetical protein